MWKKIENGFLLKRDQEILSISTQRLQQLQLKIKKTVNILTIFIFLLLSLDIPYFINGFQPQIPNERVPCIKEKRVSSKYIIKT